MWYLCYENINRCPFLRRLPCGNICGARITEEPVVHLSRYAEYCLSRRYRGCDVYLKGIVKGCNER